MHPITLRLPTDLLSELDEEADEAGFSSRSEYIRHLLQNRKDASELFASEAGSTTSEHDSSTDVVDTVDELSGDLTTMEDRIDALEETVGQIQSELTQTVDTPEQSDTTENRTSDGEPQDGESTAENVEAEEWEYGEAMGVCKYRCIHSFHPVVEAKARANQADLAVTLIHEYAHALLHFDVDSEPERAKREVEAEAVAYIVGRFFELDTSGSAFYLAAWENEDSEVIQDRLGRISSTAQKIIELVAYDN